MDTIFYQNIINPTFRTSLYKNDNYFIQLNQYVIFLVFFITSKHYNFIDEFFKLNNIFNL